jgi:hypothetical protein
MKKKRNSLSNLNKTNSSDNFSWDSARFKIDVDNLVNSRDTIDAPKGIQEIVLEQSGPSEPPIPYDYIGIPNPYWDNEDDELYGQFMELSPVGEGIKKSRKGHKKTNKKYHRKTNKKHVKKTKKTNKTNRVKVKSNTKSKRYYKNK